MTIKEIVQRLKTAMDDARGQESHFESWLTQNEGICDAIDALKELDKTEQEPVAVVVSTSRTDDGFRAVVETGDELLDLDTLLYATPPPVAEPHKRKPLSDEEIILIVAECASSHQHTDIHFARAIEAKLKEKNNG